ncbi:MAG: hypothetical protein AABY78_03090 [Nitrospirota bacterium]
MAVFKANRCLNPDGSINKNAPNYGKAVERLKPLHESMMDVARAQGRVRDAAVTSVFQEAGVKPPEHFTGTNPSSPGGRGIHSDFELTARSGPEYDKLSKTFVEKFGNKNVEIGPDYIKHKGSNTVIHRPSGVQDPVGSSAWEARSVAQNVKGETLGSAASQEKYQKVGGEFAAKDAKGAGLDGVKKAQEAWNSNPNTPYEQYQRTQELAKATNEINKAAGKPVDSTLKKIKEGMDPDLLPEVKKPVKEMAREQIKDAWKQIEAKNTENLTKLDNAIKKAPTEAEKMALKSQKIDITGRQNALTEQLVKNDSGKALTELTGQQPPKIPDSKIKPGAAPEVKAGSGIGKGATAAEEGAGGVGGKGSGVVGKTIGKILLIYGISNTAINVYNSNDKIETVKEESGGWLGGFLGGMLTGGPVGAITGAIIGSLSTNKDFSNWLAGNKDQVLKDLQTHLEKAGPAMIAGEQKKLEKNIEELRKTGALEGILNPPSPGTAGGPIYIDKEKESYKERIEAEKEKERVEKEQIKGGLENLEKTGGLKDINPPSTGTAAGTQDIGSSKISDLRGSEAKTSKIDKEKLEKSPEDQKAGMELAKNTKVTDSYDKDRSRKSKRKAKEVQDTAGSTQKERGDVSQAEDQREKTKIKGQGEETDRAISSSKQEHISAEKAAEQARQTAIGTVIAGGLFGGLSSGVAIGLDNLFGTIGKGAGQQVSSNMGIQPKPSSTGAGNQATGGTTSAAGDPLPWTYSGTCNGTVKAKANFGAGGSVGCSFSGPSKTTLNADGSVTGESSAGFWVEFSDSGSGTGCASKSGNSTFNGSHSNGSVNITGSSGSKFSGSYNANSLTYSGGRSGSSMSISGGKSATADVSTSCTYSRQSSGSNTGNPNK